VGVNLELLVQDLLNLKVEALFGLFSLPLDIYTVLTGEIYTMAKFERGMEEELVKALSKHDLFKSKLMEDI
jgi:hypothetical protein